MNRTPPYEALFGGESRAGLARMNLGDLENRVSTAEQLLEVLDDNNEEEEDAEEVEATLVIGRVTLDKPDNNDNARLNIREVINRKKRFLSGIARTRGGGSTRARIFWPFFKKCIFGQ